jgi:hypothetical protein
MKGRRSVKLEAIEARATPRPMSSLSPDLIDRWELKSFRRFSSRWAMLIGDLV